MFKKLDKLLIWIKYGPEAMRCPTCHLTVLRETCWCGESLANHRYANHDFTEAGCVCGYLLKKDLPRRTLLWSLDDHWYLIPIYILSGLAGIGIGSFFCQPTLVNFVFVFVFAIIWWILVSYRSR